MASVVFRVCSVLFALAISSVAFAQPTVNALRANIGVTGSVCTIHSGTGAPSTSLGAVCDTYLRKDSPYTVYVKTGASTWSEIYRAGGTDVAVADGGTGVSSWTPGQVVYASGSTTLAGMADLTLTSGDLVTSPSGLDILPGTNYTYNIGSLTKKYLSLNVAELFVDTLVAQTKIATIGGRIMVGPTTELTSDLTSGATSIVVKHNQIANGDRLFMEGGGKIEFLAVTSGPSGSGPYTYSVTRDLDGTGANQWYAGDAVFDTGQTGSGFIDMFSLGSSAFVGYKGIFNYDAALNAYSANYFETDVWSPFGDNANNTVNDAFYIGSPVAFGTLSAHVITPITTTGTVVWEFWNGSAWTSFTPTGAGFGSAGPGAITFGTLTGWTSTTVNSVSAFWIRLRLSVVGTTTAGTWRLTKRGPQQWGPTIIGNVRVSSTYNDWYPRWVLGNLNGTYGYTSTTYGAGFGEEAAANITIDSTNGIRFRNGTTDLLTLTSTALDLKNTGVIKSGSATALGSGTGIWIAANSGNPQVRVGVPGGNRVEWDGTNLKVVSANATIDQNGVTIAANTSGVTWGATNAFAFSGMSNTTAGMGGVAIGSSNRAILNDIVYTGSTSTMITQNRMFAQHNGAGTGAYTELSLYADGVGGVGSSSIVMETRGNGGTFGYGLITMNGWPNFGNDGTTLAGALCGYIVALYQGDMTNTIRIPFYAANGGSCPTVP